MNVGHKLVIGLAIAATASCVFARPGSDASRPGVTVSGTAGLIAAAPKASAKDASKIVVWLSPVNAVRPISASTGRTRYRLFPHHKTIQPGLMGGAPGRVVAFAKNEPVFRDIFFLIRQK